MYETIDFVKVKMIFYSLGLLWMMLPVVHKNPNKTNYYTRTHTYN